MERAFSVVQSLFDFALVGDCIPQSVQVGGIGGTGGGPVFLLDLQVDLFAVNGDITRGGDTQPDLIATDFNDRDLDIIADLDALV